MILFWIGAIFWTLGYDTIYAMSDVQDDALIGVKSTARRLGDKATYYCERFYWAAIFFFTAAIFYQARDWLALMFGAPFFSIFQQSLAKQILALNNGEKDYTKLFRANKLSGIWVIITLFAVVLAGMLIKIYFPNPQ